MVCEHCGAVAREGELVCEQCGAMLPVREMNAGAASIIQGRNNQAAKQSPQGSGVPDTREPVSRVLDENARSRRRNTSTHQVTKAHVHKVHRFMINWAVVWTVVICIALVCVVGAYLFLQLTDPGQLVLARMGREADATAMWTLGGEYLDQGYIEKAIDIEEAAWEKEPDRDDLYDRLLQLCEAYEAGARPDDAERIYTMLYETVDEKNPVAYSNIIRLMLDQGRRTEAAAFLKVAYDNTSDITFKMQREEMLPVMPTVALSPGRYELPRDVTLVSPQGYDVYYIIGDEGTLPEDGTLFEQPIHLDEGGWTIRAVCVSSELASDELSAKYVITLPTPAAPRPSLAAGSYNQRQRFRIKKSPDEKYDVTFYYTIDSTTPTINSPIYTGDGILLPGGRVTVRAVAVNQFGKVSNEMSVQLEIKNVPFKKYYRNTDLFNEFTLMKTTLDQFTKKFGEPQQQNEIADALMGGKCLQMIYSWGEARFYYSEKGAMLYYMDSTSSALNAPRATKIGMTEKQITDKYRDMGQEKNQDGSRSLYYDSGEKCYGKVSIIDGTHSRIDYITSDEGNEGTITLTYYMENGKCTRLVNSYIIN